MHKAAIEGKSMEVVRFMITCDKGFAESLKQDLSKIGVSNSRSSDVRGLGGEVVEFVVAGTVAVKAVAALLDLVSSAIKLGKTVHVLRVEDKELTNPTEEAIAQLRREVKASAS